MKKKINLIFLILFNLTIIYFLKDFIFNNSVDTVQEKVEVGVIIGIAIVLNFFVILFSKKDLGSVKKFVLIATFICVGYIFISPLLRGIDETAHFSRIYSFFLDSKTTDSGTYKIPKAILETNNIPEHYGNFSYIKTKIINDDLVEADKYRGARLYTPLSYLPYLLPVWILGFLIKSNLFAIVTSTRFFGFLIYLGSSIYAIKTVPKRKDFMALFCLMPVMTSMAATITGDLLTNCSIIVFIATWYRLYCEKKKITIKDIIIILIAGILAGCSKMVYALEFLLVFFLPKECFGGTNKKKYKTIGAMCLIILAVTLINLFFVAGSMDNSYENFKLQKEFILSHPMNYLAILINNIFENWFFFFSFTTNHTILQGIFDPSELVQIVYFIALLICIYKEENNLNLGKLKTFFIILIGFLIIGIIATSLYLQWTSEKLGVGIPIIDGVQSRYYVPVMLMFLICLPSKKDCLKIDENIPYYLSIWVNITILIRVMLAVL